MRSRLYIFWIAFVIWPILAGAQIQDHIPHTQFLGIEQGLSHRDVQCIHQDSQGFIWIGTLNGLNRFDGYQFKVFTKEADGLQSNTINHIIGDGQGLMWLFNTTNQLFETPSSIDIFNPSTEEVLSFEEKFGKSAPFSLSDIFSFAATGDGRIVFSTIKNQLVIYTPRKGFEVRRVSLRSFMVQCFSAHQTIWGFTYNNHTNIREEIVEIDFKGNILYRFKPQYPIQNIFIAGVDPSDNLWFIIKRDSEKSPHISEGELFRITGRQEPAKIIFNKKNAPINALNLNSVGIGGRFQCWINPLRGSFYLFSGESFQVFHPEKGWYNELGPANKYLAMTNTVFFDRRGQAWIGTEFGVYHIEIVPRPFRQILHDEKEENHRAFRGITQDGQGDIWASNDKGDGFLWRIRQNNGEYSTAEFGDLDVRIAEATGFKYALFADSEGAIWFGSGQTRHVIKYQPQTNEYKVWPVDIPRRIESLEVNIWSFYEDEHKRIWFGSDAGRIGYVDKNKKVFLLQELEGVNEAGGCIYQFVKDKAGKLWVATDNGLFLLDTEKKETKLYRPKTGKTPWEGVFFIHEDADGSFWLGSKGLGLFHWNRETNDIEQFTKADGLSNNTVYGIYEDEYHNLWMPSDYGIIRFNKNTRKSTAYLQKDGISHNEFNRISHYRTQDGTMFFGSLNGITAFHPRDFQADNFDLDIPLVITGFQQFIGSENKLADKKNELLKSCKITISPNDRFFLLEFALLAYDKMENVQYAYRIEDLGAEWIYQKENSIHMSRLPYGKHLLRIKGQAPDGHWSTKELQLTVVVLKPFYLQIWFIILAGLVFLAAGFFILRWRTASLERTQAKLEAEVARQTATIRQQAEELKALDEFKNRFFANVSHELRTPLTLILGPIGTLINSGELSKSSMNMLKLAQTNAQSLLKLVSSILDLSKIEADEMKIHESPQALFPFMRRLVSNFESHAQHLGINYLFEYRADKNLQLNLDAERLEIIINNLLSNAMKFTPKGGTVSIQIDDLGHFIQIAVEDTGKGILPDDLPHVFDRFFQSRAHDSSHEGGTGIGLTLCKELAQLMGGNISVTSEWQKGSRFILEIPRKEVLGSMVAVDQAPVESLSHTLSGPGEKSAQGDQGFLLLVEDNYSLREFLETILSPFYQVRSASNGAEALELLPECMHTPVWQQKGGLIMSDIMMPVMDGFQFLEYLKGNLLYAHIPVIMLTARADIKDKLHALRAGVDDYLLKPFIEEELLARIANLLLNYRGRKFLPEELEEPAGNEPNTAAPQITPENLLWLKELESLVQNSVTHDTLSVQWIADQVFLSERQLHRRLKSITGLTPIEYIREIRLQEARRLLENRLVGSVKKAAHHVCFHDEKYFAQIFKARFGKSPSEI